MITDEQHQHAIAVIQQAFLTLEWALQPAKIKRFSHDFHQLSPVLTEQLAGKQADAVVHPHDEEESRQLVAACAQHQLPLMLYGSATGNYGQLVSPEDGLLVGMTGFDQIVALGNSMMRTQAGIRLADIETAARPTGWELRCIPSTYRLASLGDLYGGGFGDVGSINYGPLVTPGNMLNVKVMTAEPAPRVLTVSVPEALLLHRACGTNDIILEIELAPAPVHQWIERLDVPDDFADALNYANARARSPELVRRQIALLATSIADYFNHLNDRYRTGQHVTINLIAEENGGLCASLLQRHRESNIIRRANGEVRTQNASLMKYC